MSEHHGRQKRERDRADDFVEEPFRDIVPIGDRLVEEVDHRDGADARIGAGGESQLRGACRHLDVGRQDRKPARDIRKAFFCRERQRHDDEIDVLRAAHGDEIVEAAKAGIAGDLPRSACVAAIVENAGDAHDRVGVGFEVGDAGLR